MNTRQKLELTWIGKNKWPKLELRILVENEEKSYHVRRGLRAENLILYRI